MQFWLEDGFIDTSTFFAYQGIISPKGEFYSYAECKI